MDDFHDELTLHELFEAGKAKFTPLISLGRLLQLHRYAMENDCIVSYFEAFEIEGGQYTSLTDLNMNGFPENIQTSAELIAFANNEMAALVVAVANENLTCGFEAWVESSVID